tara:strand:+ start:2057 stop:2734 length:678 start_codon:yes stop_codon:yes gene_type:complete
MEDLDEKIIDELKEKAIERSDDLEITSPIKNTIDEELLDESVPTEPPQEVKKSKKVRSEKQIAAFEKARLKRAENLKIKKQLEAEKKAQKKKEKEEVKAQVKERLENPRFPEVNQFSTPEVQRYTDNFREQVVNNYYYYGRPPVEEEEEPFIPKKKKSVRHKKKSKKKYRPPTPSESSESEEEFSDAEEPQSYKELQGYDEDGRYAEQEEEEVEPEQPKLKFRFA